jgi:hypothetical protein
VTVTAPSTEEMAGTGTRTVASRYSTAPELRSMIQVLQDRSTTILEFVNQEGGRNLEGVALGAPMNTHPSTARVAMFLPPTPPREEDAPPCSTLLNLENVHPPPPHGKNELLVNLVSLLQQQNNRLQGVEENQEKIPMEIYPQIEVAQRNEHHKTPLIADNALDKGSNCHSPRHSHDGKPPGHNGKKYSPPRRNHRKKDDCSQERHRGMIVPERHRFTRFWNIVINNSSCLFFVNIVINNP